MEHLRDQWRHVAGRDDKWALGEQGQLSQELWVFAEPVSVKDLSKLSLHQRTRDLGPLDANVLAQPVTILWAPYMGKAVIGDGNHRIAKAMQEGRKTLLAVVVVASDFVGDGGRPFVRVPVNHYGPQTFPEDSVWRPSEVLGISRHSARGEVIGDIGFPVERVRIDGMKISGVVIEGIGWRVIGSWDELRDAIRRGAYRSEGTYTGGDEGRTQFASHPSALMRWGGGSGRRWNPVALVEVDLHDLPFRMLLSPDQWEQAEFEPTEGTIWPDTGTGLGIEGDIPLDRIKAVHLFSDGRITESFTDWRSLVSQKTAMALPDFKNPDRNMTEKQFLSACKKILTDIAKEFGYKGPLPDLAIESLGGSVVARSYDPSPTSPNGLIIIDPLDVEKARDREQGYEMFRTVAHEAIHNLLQRQMKSYEGSTQIIGEGSAEILSVVYWAKNGPGFGIGTKSAPDADAIHEQGYGWVGGDVALTSRINYPEFIVEVLVRAASKVGWDQARIFAEVKRISGADHNGAIKWLQETKKDFALPSGMPHTAEGMLLWLVRGFARHASVALKGVSMESLDRCTNAAFEAITGQCPRFEIVDGGHFLSLLKDVGFGYEVLGRVAPTVSALMKMPEYQTGLYYFFTSGHAMALVDGVLTDTEERGPDGRRIIGVYRIIRRAPVTAALSDFERGDRVEAAGEMGSVVGIRGQGNVFTKGYILISFDSDPDRPAWYPWREVRKVGKTSTQKTPPVDDDDWSMVDRAIPLTEITYSRDLDLDDYSRLGVVDVSCLSCGQPCGIGEGDHAESTSDTEMNFPAFKGIHGETFCESCVFTYEQDHPGLKVVR